MEFKEWLGDNELSYTIWNNKYRFKNETLDEWFERVSGGYEPIKKLIINKKFLFGGRALTNRNTGTCYSLNNCYSSGFVKDSLEDILATNTNIALTYKAQGGQGLSLSKIRPKGALIKDLHKSDGIIPFMEMFNTTTNSIIQGAGRRGALLMSIDVWHPEASSFITIKSDLSKINKANLSLEIDDEFMRVINDDYHTHKTTTVHRVFEYQGGSYEYDVVPIELFKLIAKTACKTAEPGVIFTNSFRNYNIMEYDPDYQIETCNP